MSKILEGSERWQKVRDDDYLTVFEMTGVKVPKKTRKGDLRRLVGLPLVLQVAFVHRGFRLLGNPGGREEWIGFYHPQNYVDPGRQQGLSFKPREDFPSLIPLYNRIGSQFS